MQNILAIHAGHDATALLLSEGGEVFSIAEERISRTKNHFGVPFRAMERLASEVGAGFKNIEKVVVCGYKKKDRGDYGTESMWNEWRADNPDEEALGNRIRYLRSKFTSWPRFHDRLEKWLNEKGFSGHILYKDHHLCHVASSYAAYPLEEALMLSMDNGGDQRVWSLYERNPGEPPFNLLANSRPDMEGVVHETPAAIYSNTTKFLGYKRNRHEGKLTGLAAYGNPRYINYFRNLLSFQGGQFWCRLPKQKLSQKYRLNTYWKYFTKGETFNTWMLSDMQQHLKKAKAADVAASLQEFCQEIMIEFLRYHLDGLGAQERPLLLSGGLFANVLLNQHIRDSGLVGDVQVVPNMGDGGLPLGGGYLAAEEDQRDQTFPGPFRHIYFGPDYSQRRREEALELSRVSYRFVQEQAQRAQAVARALAQGYVVGLFVNGMEDGPRALGARTILANPSRGEINDELNGRLGRTEFMPFAPVIRAERAPDCLQGWKAADYCAQFMTITYYLSDDIKRMAPAITHLDGTARPQILYRDVNSIYYDILEEFERESGIPILVNTSFNTHEEPIVMNPDHAVKAYQEERVDFLLLEDYLVAPRHLLEEFLG